MVSFKDVIGQKDVMRYINNAVSTGQISHAYIVNGERGSGKKLIASLFAAALLCEGEGVEPCNKCHSCIQADTGNHPDIIRLVREKENSISVEEVREQINNTVAIKPYQSDYKIYIIPGADKMTVQAQNAILKTIEEPPEYAIFFLLTENAESLLPTITSRCVMLKLRYIKDTLIKKYLMEKLEVPDYRAEVCTAFAQGNLGRAMMLCNSEHFNDIREEAIHLLKYIHEMELSEIVDAVSRATKFKMEISDYLDMIMIWYRDILLYKATKDIDKVVFKEEINYIKEQAMKSSYEGIELILESLDKAKSRLKANVNFELAMELLFLTIKEN